MSTTIPPFSCCLICCSAPGRQPSGNTPSGRCSTPCSGWPARVHSGRISPTTAETVGGGAVVCMAVTLQTSGTGSGTPTVHPGGLSCAGRLHSALQQSQASFRITNLAASSGMHHPPDQFWGKRLALQQVGDHLPRVPSQVIPHSRRAVRETRDHLAHVAGRVMSQLC